ncbi:MAG: tetratricopeptide repeat protein [Ignavibacteriaceae bacterium]
MISKMNILFILFFIITMNIFAQPDRKINNQGVDDFESGNFAEAEINFKKGLEKAPENFIANFNHGDALYKQEKYDEAISSYKAALGDADNDLRSAKIHHNIGNALLKSNKIQESIDAYKTALKHNPDDADTKYNLSYALSLLDNQDQNQQQDQNKDKQDNQDQNKQDQQNQNQDEQQKDQQNDQQQNQPQPKDQETQQDNLKQPQQQEAKISKEDAQRILEALKNNEKDLQKELRKKTGRPVKTDKDW